MSDSKSARSTVIPGMHYRNAPQAIAWLCHVFGFEKHAVYPGQDNTILHAELTLNGGMIMLGSYRESGGQWQMKTPQDLDGSHTHGINLVVEDADAVYARAQANGAKVIQEIENKPYGGRGFACLDPEGYLWHVGTYDPWTAS